MTKMQTPWGVPAQKTVVHTDMWPFTAMTAKVKAALTARGWTLTAPGK
jgi:hypothetical protein